MFPKKEDFYPYVYLQVKWIRKTKQNVTTYKLNNPTTIFGQILYDIL